VIGCSYRARRAARRALRLLPDATHVTLHGLGHLPMWDGPDVVAEVLLAGTAAPATVAA